MFCWWAELSKRGAAVLIALLILALPAIAQAQTWDSFRSDHAGWIERDHPAPPRLGAVTSSWLDAREAWATAVRLRTSRWFHRWQALPSPSPVSNPSYGGVSYIGGGDMGALIRSIFGATGDAAVSVASCESGLDPNAQNPSGAAGLFQFVESWWDGPDDVPFTADDPWNPFDPVANTNQAFVASNGGTDWSAWSCQP